MVDQSAATPSKLLRDAADKFSRDPVCSPTPLLDARLLLMHALGIDEAGLIAKSNIAVEGAQVATFKSFVQRRKNNEPIAYIIGYREFWKSRFKVTRDVLIPRPDSEILIETALTLRPQTDKPIQIADLGTGSGCLLASLLLEYPRAMGIGVDKQRAAAMIASENLDANNLSARAQIVQGDWLTGLDGPFDIIISNPPYIDEQEYRGLASEITRYEPRSALVSPESGQADYGMILRGCAGKIATSGLILIEIGDGQRDFLEESASRLFPACKIGIYQDLAGLDRCLSIDFIH